MAYVSPVAFRPVITILTTKNRQLRDRDILVCALIENYPSRLSWGKIVYLVHNSLGYDDLHEKYWSLGVLIVFAVIFHMG